MPVIKIKRGVRSSLPTLSLGELGWAIDTNELFIGGSTGNKRVYPITWDEVLDKPSTFPPSNHNHLPLEIAPQGHNSGLNSDQLDRYHASTTPGANLIPVANSTGKLDPGWIPSTPGNGGSISFLTTCSSFPPKPPGYNDYIVPYALAGTAATTLALTASRTYWIPITITFNVTLNQVAINVTTASAGTHYVGIYASNNIGEPTNLMISWSFDTGSTGVKTSTSGLPLTLTTGVYWIAWAAGSGATVRAVALAAARSLALPALGTANLTCWYTSGNTLPSTAPTSGYTALTGSALPAVGFYYTLTSS